MTMPELIAAAAVLSLAAGSSLQLWSGSLAASQATLLQRRQLDRIEAQLLRSKARLRAAADQQLAVAQLPFLGCAQAAAWMAEQLQAADLGAPAGLARQVGLEPDAMVALVYRDQELDLERQRRWSPVAFGLCSALDFAPPLEPTQEQTP
ncbi:MAG: hypothetical protein R6W06_00895 [Prochlorococcaceae cyanobacterium]